MFSLESLGQISKALAASDSGRMLEVVGELDANGRSLQHFARELARYFRNLLVLKIAGGPSRLVAASPAEQQGLIESAAPFTEEDLTRYLQLTLDLFRDLQNSLQPRLHLEIGLLRMVQAGKLQSIEEALAGLGGASAAPSKPTPPRAVPAASPKAVAPPQTAVLPGGDLRSRLHAALIEAKLTHVADAVEHSALAESDAELVFTTPKMYQMFLKQAELGPVVQKIAGRPVRVTVKIGEPVQAPTLVAAPAREDEAAGRALSHPEVKRFQEMFPDSQVRAVRNLKETQS
jgi:DNA polymerase-3 subunit gamma/tau